eukprot:2210522-Rhodomonas_salina.6
MCTPQHTRGHRDAPLVSEASRIRTDLDVSQRRRGRRVRHFSHRALDRDFLGDTIRYVSTGHRVARAKADSAANRCNPEKPLRRLLAGHPPLL